MQADEDMQKAARTFHASMDLLAARHDTKTVLALTTSAPNHKFNSRVGQVPLSRLAAWTCSADYPAPGWETEIPCSLLQIHCRAQPEDYGRDGGPLHHTAGTGVRRVEIGR